MSWHSDNEMVNLRDVIEVLCYMVDEDSDGVEEVLQLPTIDLVRCKECKHHEDFPTGISPLTCSLSWGGVFENDYCSYGERRDNNE